MIVNSQIIKSYIYIAQKLKDSTQTEKMSTKTRARKVLDPCFIYLNWRKDIQNPRISFLKDRKDSVLINTTTGPYKNVYSQQVLEKNNVYVWQIRIDSGTFIKVGIIKETQLTGTSKFKAFSDSKYGYALFSPGNIRNGSNKEGTQFGKGFGPGDTVTVKLDTQQGKLYFAVNDEKLQLAYESVDFKNGGYVAAVAALHEGAIFSLALPNLQD